MNTVPNRAGKHRAIANPEYAQAMRDIRRSGATTPQESREDRRGSKASRNKSAIQQSMRGE